MVKFIVIKMSQISSNLPLLKQSYHYSLFILLFINKNKKQSHLIYNNYLMYFKRFPKFWFCTDRFRYNAAQTVLSIVYNSKFKTKMKVGDKTIETQLLLLHDEVIEALQKMKQDKIDDKTFDQLKNMFTPALGIKLQKSFSLHQIERLEKAKNKNNRISFILDPIISKLILSLLYEKNDYDKFETNLLATHVLYIVGTPGLGKSVKFMAAKVLLDMRIRYIIKNGLQIQSKFANNHKFFYFLAESTKENIMLSTLQEVKKDFDVVPDYITSIEIQNQSNFFQFMSNVSRAYLSKKIRLRLVLDQVNAIYNILESERAEQIRKWKEISSCFEFPIIMVSSKNNSYLQKYDPIISFANSSKNNIKHKKIILDNLISPQQRLTYSYNCLAFQLSKYELDRTRLIQILQKVTLPILTHLSITNFVHIAFKDFNAPQNNLNNNNKKQQIQQILNKQLNFIEALDNIRTIIKESDIQHINMKYYLEFMSNILNFSLKNTKSLEIKLNMMLKDLSKKVHYIQKKMMIPKKQIKDQQNFQIMAQSNYFFASQIDKINYVFSCISVQKMEKIRMDIISCVSIKFLSNLKKRNKNQYEILIKNNAGYIFQTFVTKLYSYELIEQKLVTTKMFLDFDEELVHKTNVISNDLFQIDKQQSYKTIFQASNKFIKSAPNNPAFDFILTKFKNNHKHLILVDSTTSFQILPIMIKIAKFKKTLFSKEIRQPKQQQKEKLTNFRNQIFSLLKSDNKFTIQIICYVLTAIKIENQKFFYNGEIGLELLENIALMELIETSLDDEKTKEKKKDNKQLILKGRELLLQFKEELRQIGFENRVTIKFRSGEILKKFQIQCDNYSKQLKSQIVELPQFLVEQYMATRKLHDIEKKQRV